MSRNFNNTNLTDSSINFNIQNINTKLDTLPTTIAVNTLISNSHILNNLNNLSLSKIFTAKQTFNTDVDITGTLVMNSNYTLNYNTLPIITSNRQIGFFTSTSNLVNFSLVDSYFALVALTIPIGIYIINYSINLNINNINGPASTLWLYNGLGTSLASNNLQSNKNFCSCRFSSTNNSPMSHSLYFVSSVAQTINLNVMVGSFDNPNIATNIVNFAATGIINYIRIG